MKRIIYIAAFAAITLASCTRVEKLELQKISSPDLDHLVDNEYTLSLKAWKNSDHVRTFVYFAAYAPPEGSTSMYITYSSSANRFLSLPDSLDIVNLWLGNPCNDARMVYDKETDSYKHIYDYSPYAWQEMQYCRKMKGTKFVMHADASKNPWNIRVIEEDEEGRLVEVQKSLNRTGNAEDMQAYADHILHIIYDYEIDGVDIDYEGWDAGSLSRLVSILSEKIGPYGEDPDKLLIVDFFGTNPPASIQDQLSFCVKQAYSGQGAGNTTPASGYSQSKMIYCEQYNQGNPAYFNTGGAPKGNWTDEETGETYQMYSLESFARDCVAKGGAGFGAFYIDKDYFNGNEALESLKGHKKSYYNYEHYSFLRRAIAIANPVGAWPADE